MANVLKEIENQCVFKYYLRINIYLNQTKHKL